MVIVKKESGIDKKGIGTASAIDDITSSSTIIVSSPEVPAIVSDRQVPLIKEDGKDVSE